MKIIQGLKELEILVNSFWRVLLRLLVPDVLERNVHIVILFPDITNYERNKSCI